MSDLDRENVRQEERARLVNDSEPSAAQQAAKKKKKKILFIAIGLLLLVGVILAIVLPLTLKKGGGGGGGGGDNGFNVIDSQEYNIYGVDKTTEVSSVFNVSFVLKNKVQLQKLQSASQQFMGLGDAEHKNTDYRPVNPKDVPVDTKAAPKPNNPAIEEVRVHVDMVDNYNMRLFLKDNQANDNHVYAVPEPLFPRPVLSWESRLTQINFQVNYDTFEWSIGNIYTKNEILSTKKRKLFMSEKFSEIGFILPSKRCYGLGQRNSQFQLQYGSYTLHSRYRENGLQVDDGLGDKGGNHIHPFIMCQTKDKDFMGMFFVGSSPQQFEIVETDKDDRMILNYITMGGPIEIYTIMRGKVDDIIGKYHGMIGYSMMPPFYALGFFQGSNTYKSLDQVKTVVQGFTDVGMPLEGIFLTNYNQLPHQTFTVNSNTFKGLTDYYTTLKGSNQHIIMGASLAIQGNYDVFNAANTQQCLVQSLQYSGKNLMGVIDKTEVYYVDAHHENTAAFLNDQLGKFYDLVGGFEGLYLQDTHLPNHISGEVAQGKPSEPSVEVKGRLLDVGTYGEEQLGSFQPYQINANQIAYSTYNLPYQPTSKNLDYLTVSLNATHASGLTNMVANMKVHNINGHAHLKNAYTVLSEQPKTSASKPLLFTDSTWAGSGAYGAAIITDQMRTWDNLKNTISMTMGLSLYGVGNTMVDSCGSLGKMNLELCARWMQLSAFLPMVRNFYNETYTDPTTGKTLNTDPSEPSAFASTFNYQTAYTSAASNRLPYIRYIYSQLYYAYRYGAAVVRPHFYDYFEDDEAFNNPEHTYMLGDSIKVSPVLKAGLKDGDTYGVYFPQGLWHDLNNLGTVIDTTAKGAYVNIKASDTNTNIHLKGGKIIPIQRNTQGLKTTKDFETKMRTSFVIARDAAKKYAEGYVLIDDGISADSYAILDDNHQKFTYWKLRYADKSINFWVQEGDFSYEPPADYQIHFLNQIEILNAEDIKDSDFACFLGLNLSPVKLMKPSYNKDTKVLTIKPDISHPDVKFNEIGFIKFGNSKTDQNFCDQKTFQYTVSDKDVKDDHKWTYHLTSVSGNKDLYQPLVATFIQMDDIGTLNVEITTEADFNEPDQFKKLYRPPADAVYNPNKDTFFPRTNLKKKLSDFIEVTEATFSYTIYKDANDKSTKLWRSDPTRLYISDFFVLDSGIFLMNQADGFDQPLIGMGERAGDVFYKNQNGAIHSRKTFDQANPIDDGLPPGRNMYGYQPFYAFQSNNAATKDWFGVFDLSSYATDYIVFSDNGLGQKETQIHKINIGGVITKYFFVGQKPDDLIKTYSKLVGFPTLPPIWAFGWQQCRFGWVTDQDWLDVYTNYTDPKIDLPLDTMWADIDYMDDYKLFTISQQSYKNLPAYVKKIKEEKGIKFVPIMDAGVAVRLNQNYKALDDGIKNKVFIKQDNKQDFLTAGVWCGNAYFPDFFKPETISWWKNNFNSLTNDYGLIFDGIWLDENEATNFCNGYCKPEERPADSYRNKPFYVPGWRDLEDKAIGVDGWHDSIKRREYDVHNLFPLMQTKATAEYLKSINKRPYILSRSDFPGIGKYGHHWMGDNWSTVEYMALSVDGIFSYNLFSLPFMGSDICGFNGDATNELCTRWHILGSLYPFARNHNQNASKSQEPYRFSDTVNKTTSLKFYDVIRSALVNRYSFVKYYYSSFFTLALEGGSYFKPLFYEYPLDPLAYQDLQVNILLGNALKVSMETTNLDFMKGPSSRKYYFPQDRWCRIFPEIQKLSEDCFDSPGGANGYQTFVTTLESYYIHLRNGYVLPFQNVNALEGTDKKVRRTGDLEKIPTDLYILPVQDNVDMTLSKTVSAVARGYLFFDDGISVIDQQDKTNPYAKFEFYMIKGQDGKTFSITINNVGLLKKSATPKAHERLGNVKILWSSKSGVSNIKTATITTGAGAQPPINVSIDPKSETLTIPVSTDDKTFTLLWDIVKIDLA